MKKIKIAKEFFSLSSPISNGLISNLKKISDNNYAIEIINYENIVDPIIQNILKLEKINILSAYSIQEKFEAEYTITIQKKNKTKKDEVLLNEKHVFVSFESAVNYLLKSSERVSNQNRKTKETDINVYVNLDEIGNSSIFTGIGFFDHMLEQIAKHANINLKVNVKGDLFVDEHHTVEDVGITLGNAIADALGEKKGIKRYGYFLPMDDTVAKCAIDLGGRAYLNFKVDFKREKIGDFPTELTEEFFRGIANGMKANIYLRSKGRNDHHKIEALFKAFAKSLNEASRFDERNKDQLPTTKGML